MKKNNKIQRAKGWKLKLKKLEAWVKKWIKRRTKKQRGEN